MSAETQFHSLVQDYNLSCKRKYRRMFWRDLAPEAFAQHPSLRDALLSWADREGKLRIADAPAINRFLNETHSFETAACFAKQFDIDVNLLPTTRATTSR